MIKILFILTLSVFSQGLFAWDCASRIVMIPAPISDPVLSQKIVETIARNFADAKKLSCNPFLSYEETTPMIDILGISTYFTIEPKNLSKKQIRLIKKELSATHIMYASRKGDSGLKFISDIFLLTEEDTLILDQQRSDEFKESEFEKFTTSTLPRVLAKYAPNNISIGFTGTQISMTENEKYNRKETKVRGGIPPILSSISLSKIEHRKGYNLFDVGGTVFPGVFFFAIDQDTKIQLKDRADETPQTPYEKTLHVEAYGACSNLNAEGSLYSPIGTLYAGFGWGPCFLQTRQDDSAGVTYLSAALRFSFGYRVFVTDSVNLFFSGDSLSFNRRIYQGTLAESNNITRAIFGIGYFIPSPETTFMKAWNTVF